MRSWIELIIRRRLLVLALSALVTMLALLSLRSLKVVIDPDEALPRTHPYVMANARVEKIFGNKLTMVIGVHLKEGSVLEPARLALIRRLTDRIASVPGAVPGSAFSLGSSSAQLMVPTPAGPQPVAVGRAAEIIPPEAFARMMQGHALYSGLLFSPDLKTAQILVEFSKVPEGFAHIDHQVRDILRSEASEGTEFWLGGVPAFLSLLEKFSERMKFLFPLAILLIGLIHYEAFRTLQALFLPLVTALLAVIWALGLLGAAGQPIDVFNASTPILILAIAAGHAVQILKRYYEEFARLKEEGKFTGAELNRRAVLESLSKVGPVMVAACLVAACGFLSLVVFDIKSIQVFGLFTGIGVLSALILELTFIPALRASLPPPGEKEYQRERSPSVWDKAVSLLLILVLRKRTAIFYSFAFLAAALAFFGSKVEMENSQKSYFWGEIQERRDDDLLNEKMAGTNSLYLLVEAEQPGGIWRENVLGYLSDTQAWLATQPIVGRSVSIADLARSLTAGNAGGPPLALLQNIPAARNLVDSKGQTAKLQILLKTDRTPQVEALIQSLKKRPAPEGAKVEIGGGVAGGVALNEVMIREKILNIAQIMGAVFLVSALLFRSLLAGALVLVPLVAAVLANFGVMGAFGIPLQIATALVSAMAVGIGADYGIYLSYRLREELAAPGATEENAIRRAFLSAGKATLFVSSAVAGGFGVLMLSIGFNVHFWMGLLIGVSMLVSSVTALTLFPALLLTLRPKFIFGKNRAAA